MRDIAGKRYWLIGASEGLGRALALTLSRAGVEVIVSARNAERLEAVVAELPGRGSAQVVDVSDTASVQAAAEAVGPVDGMVYLAGLYWPMKATAWDTGKALAMADVNFSGALRSVGAVLPGMLDRGAGHIVLTGSLAGFRGLPGAVGYSGSKAAVVSLAETLKADLRGTGVEVQIANPGFIKTRLTDKNDFDMPFLMTAEAAAQAMFELMISDRFKKSYPFAFASFFRLGQVLPDWIWDRLIRGAGSR